VAGGVGGAAGGDEPAAFSEGGRARSADAARFCCVLPVLLTGTPVEAEATALLVAPGSVAADAVLADEPEAAGAADGFVTPVARG